MTTMATRKPANRSRALQAAGSAHADLPPQLQRATSSLDPEAEQKFARSVVSAPTAAAALRAVYRRLRPQIPVRSLTLRYSGPGYDYDYEAGLPPASMDSPKFQAVRTLELELPAPKPCRGTVTVELFSDEAIDDRLLTAAAMYLEMWLHAEVYRIRAEAAATRAEYRLSEVSAIYEIARAIDQIEHPDLLRLITERATQLTGAEACSLMLLGRSGAVLEMAASTGLPPDAASYRQRLGEGIVGKVALGSEPVLLAGHRPDSRVGAVRLRPEIGSSILAPMVDAASQVLGVLSIRRSAGSTDFTQEDVRLISVFAAQAAQAIANHRLYSDLKTRALELEKMSALTQDLIATIGLDERLQRIAEAVCSTVGFSRCCVLLREPGATFEARAVSGDIYGIGWDRHSETLDAISNRGRPSIFAGVHRPEGYSVRGRLHVLMAALAQDLRAHSLIGIPLQSRELSAANGVVLADSGDAPITRQQIELFTAFVSQAAISIDNAALYQETSETLDRIRRLQAYTDGVLESVGAGILSTDRDGAIVRWNRGAEAVLNRSPNYIRGKTIVELIEGYELPTNERTYLLETAMRVLETGEPAHIKRCTLHPANLPAITLNLIWTRLGDLAEPRRGVVVIIEDVTQESRLEEELDKMRRMADIGQLGARLAHEVRNALSPIKGAAQIIRGELDAQGVSTEWPDIILTEVDGLSRLMSAMLDFARPTPIEARHVDVNEFLVPAVLGLAGVLHEHGIRLSWSLAPGLQSVALDNTYMAQVVRNLVLNAVQAMPEGGELQVATSMDPQQSWVTIMFKDTGVGIPEDEIDRVFRPFVTTKAKGTGLGLAIVQKLVDHHGGKVLVESRPGKGTCFSVLLPVLPTGRRTSTRNAARTSKRRPRNKVNGG